jgi:hypothetical protein
MPLDTIKQHLARAGIRYGYDNVTIGQIAGENSLTPLQVYREIVRGRSATNHVPMEGRGYGRMSMSEVARMFEVDSATSEERLREHGIEPDWDATVRELASEHNISPHDLVEIIRKGN